MAWRIPTALLACSALIAGYAVAVISGSRPLGGGVLALLGLTCTAVWLKRDGPGTALGLTLAGLMAFALSHVLALALGAWPAVLVVSAAMAGVCWQRSDARRLRTNGPAAEMTRRS